MKAWAYAALASGLCNSALAGEAHPAPRPIHVYSYQDELSTKFATGLTGALIVLGGFSLAPEEHPANQLSLLLGRPISPAPKKARFIQYDIEFRDSDGATLGYISDTCQAAQFAGCFTPIVVRAKQISDAMAKK
jgi:hypothetical protein